MLRLGSCLDVCGAGDCTQSEPLVVAEAAKIREVLK